MSLCVCVYACHMALISLVNTCRQCQTIVALARDGHHDARDELLATTAVPRQVSKTAPALWAALVPHRSEFTGNHGAAVGPETQYPAPATENRDDAEAGSQSEQPIV